MTLRQALRALERIIIDVDASLELRPERGGICAMVVPTKDRPAVSAWATDAPAAIIRLADGLRR